MRTLLLTLLLVSVGMTVRAQIRRFEYGWDTDKGHGLNTVVSVTGTGQDADVDLTIPLKDLTNGYHLLFVRTQDSRSRWSHTYLRLVNVRAGTVPAKIVQVDYVYSQGVTLVGQYSYKLPTPATSIQLTVPGDVSQLKAGQAYTLSVWATDENGTRSQIYQRTFTYRIVDCQALTATITASAPGFVTGGSVTLTAATNTGQTYQWTLAGQPIAGANTRTYIARQPGTYAVSTTNTDGCSATALPVTIGLITAVDEPQPDPDFQVSVSPNPGQGPVQVQLVNQRGKTVLVTLTVRDLAGRSLYQKQVKLSGQHTESLDFSQHPAGLYLLHAATDTQERALRFIRE